MSDETPVDKDRDKALSGLPEKYRGSPWGAVALGLLLSVLGGLALADSPPIGVLALVPGAILVQFGVIAAGVEYGIRRVDQERWFQ